MPFQSTADQVRSRSPDRAFLGAIPVQRATGPGRGMQLRILVAAALIVRLRHRSAWRRRFLAERRQTVPEVLAASGGMAAEDALQDWLIRQAVMLANRPRRPRLLREEELDSDSDWDDEP